MEKLNITKIVMLAIAVIAIIAAGKFGVDIGKTLKEANQVLVEVGPLLEDDKATPAP